MILLNLSGGLMSSIQQSFLTHEEKEELWRHPLMGQQPNLQSLGDNSKQGSHV